MDNIYKIVISILIICFLSCNKKVEDVNTNFIGYWKHPDYHMMCILEIDEDSRGDYREDPQFSEGGHRHVKGFARLEGSLLKISPYVKFNIIEFPTKLDTSLTSYYMINKNGKTAKANWRMKLELPKRFLGSGNFYMIDY